MKKLTALAIAAVSAPLAIGLTAAPASAASNCDGVYPPGQAYKLRISPSYANIKKGASIQLFTRLVRGNAECNGERVGWYTRGKGGTIFRLSRATTTQGRGLVSVTYVASNDFRFFTDHLRSNARVAQSPGGLIQTNLR